MKAFKIFYRVLSVLMVMAVVFIAYSCEEEETQDIEHNPSSSFEGKWKRSNMETYVWFSGSTATTCSGGVTTVGSFDASEPSMTFVVGGETIKFPLKINDDALLVGVPDQVVDTHTAQIYYKSDSFPCDGGGNGGGGGGGGNGDGNIMFWVQSDLGCGAISVTLTGQGSGSISSFYGSAPSCGASGCANFSVPAGSYSFTASCSERTWDGTVTVSADQCYKMQLTL
jgi:hypothetical protein